MTTDSSTNLDGSLQVAMPPTQHELPCEDDENLETERHKLQMDLLIYPLRDWLTRQQREGYVGGNMFVYFSLAQVRHQDFRGPDVFVVLDVPPGERRSWVVWEEGKGPDVVIELLSEKTAEQDRGPKKQIYQEQLRVGEYYWFDPFNPDELVGLGLRCDRYQPMTATDEGYLPCHKLGLLLRRWQGRYAGVDTTWLRWAFSDGALLPTQEESRALEEQRADAEKQRAETEKQRADAAEAELTRLRALLADRGPADDS